MPTKITAQAIFTAAWNQFIVNQGEPATQILHQSNDRSKYVCCYLTDDGKKCAVGLCIPDGHPAQKNSQYAAVKLTQLYPDLFDLEDMRARGMRLQLELHDMLMDTHTGRWSYSLMERIEKYKDIALQYDLTIPAGKQIS